PSLLPGLKPKDPPSDLAPTLEILAKDIMLVSHLPFVERLASLLLTGFEEGVSLDFHPGTAVALQCRAEGVWDLLWMINSMHLDF
ncbi:MAG: hypothetical protein ACYTFG_04950, partial [Planctomycetota bacterium]